MNHPSAERRLTVSVVTVTTPAVMIEPKARNQPSLTGGAIRNRLLSASVAWGMLVCAAGSASALAAPVPTTLELKPLPELFRPAQVKRGTYALKYLESRADEHLALGIKVTDGTIRLSDAAKIRLQGCTYTINGWTDPVDCSRLEDEPIQPYTVYHVTKASIDAPMREWWRAMPEFMRNKPITVYRSEVFFVVVPEGEKWNGVGEGFNPIGRPLAFSDLPAFKLKTRVYGFEADFEDETPQRLDELDITFNRRKGRAHRMLYSDCLSRFIRNQGFDKAPRKALHDFSDEDCATFADSLPLDAFLAFDFEPPEDMQWAVDFSHARYAPVMSRVIARLGQRGAKAYCWMGNIQGLRYQGEALEGQKEWGRGNEKMALYADAHAHPDSVEALPSPNAIGLVGAGYDCYDFSFLPDDKPGQNSSPQAMYLKTLDACALRKRVEPAKDLLSFVWARVETHGSPFPPNCIVDIPALDAQAQIVDNKPSYPPSYWQDNLILALLYSRYLFSWEPGAVSWNPAHVARYSKENVLKGELVYVRMLKGSAPHIAGGFYRGVKGAAIFNATIGAAYRYSLIQEVCDEGKLVSAATTYRRSDRAGNAGPDRTYPAYGDDSQFVRAAMLRQPFTLVVRNPGSKQLVVFFQDVWSRPGRWTEFSFEFEGRIYSRMKSPDGKTQALRTNGNRLFIATVD